MEPRADMVVHHSSLRPMAASKWVTVAPQVPVVTDAVNRHQASNGVSQLPKVSVTALAVTRARSHRPLLFIDLSMPLFGWTISFLFHASSSRCLNFWAQADLGG
jgi:ABC-type hemin transport system substrate-binding protein